MRAYIPTLEGDELIDEAAVAAKQSFSRQERLRGDVFMSNEDAPFPFAHQILPRQKRKHESIRGSEARFVRNAGASLYTGIQPVSRIRFETKAFESSIEGDFWLVADFCMPDMVAAKAQPGLVVWESEGKKSRWYPDQWIRRKNKQDLLVECKPASMVHPDPVKYPDKARDMKVRMSQMKEATEMLGMTFALYTELEVRKEPRFHNAKCMQRALSAHIADATLDDVDLLLPSMPQQMTVLEFSRALGDLSGAALNIACLLDNRGSVHLNRRAYFLPGCTMVNPLGRAA